MNKILISVIAILLIVAVGFFLVKQQPSNTQSPKLPSSPQPSQTSNSQAIDKKVIATGLEIPWALVFLPGKSILVTERAGRVRFIDKDGKLQSNPIAIFDDVKLIGEGGLLGVAAHPNFSSNHFVYFYYTYESSGNLTSNRVVRFKFENNQFSDKTVIIDQIPGSTFHNGGRLKFGPDNFLYITTGDAQEPSLAQDKTSLAGKILRVTDEGKAAPGNPFNNLVYSYGHRNPQGITWASKDRMYEVEHGQSATDEFNYIEPGKNYGWPIITGNQTRSGMESPFLQSGSETWAPGGAAFYKYPDNKVSVFFGGLRGQALFEIEFIGDNRRFLTHFKDQFGRIRDVVLGPDNMLYITTSNRDGRGNPSPDDDKIILINPEKL